MKDVSEILKNAFKDQNFKSDPSSTFNLDAIVQEQLTKETIERYKGIRSYVARTCGHVKC